MVMAILYRVLCFISQINYHCVHGCLSGTKWTVQDRRIVSAEIEYKCGVDMSIVSKRRSKLANVANNALIVTYYRLSGIYFVHEALCELA